jgi:hypothetical protein
MTGKLAALVVFALAMSVFAPVQSMEAQTPRAIPQDDEKEAIPQRDALPDDTSDANRAPPPPPPPVLLLTSDMNCRVEIDGVEKALLVKDSAQEIRVRPGEHLLQAFPTDIQDGPTWKDTVKVPDTGQVVALIELADLVEDWEEGLLAEEEEGRFVIGEGMILDNESKLVWTGTTVNDVKWAEARSLCSKKSLGGLTGWRLPTVQELSTLYWPDHPDPRHEAGEGETTSKLWGMVKSKGPMEVAPALIHRPFETLPRLSSLWVSDEKVTCGFLGELQCDGGQKRGDALCVRRAE